MNLAGYRRGREHRDAKHLGAPSVDALPPVFDERSEEEIDPSRADVTRTLSLELTPSVWLSDGAREFLEETRVISRPLFGHPVGSVC